MKPHWIEKTSPHSLLDSLGALSADTRSPRAKWFNVRWIGPGNSGTLLRGHIPKYLEWKLLINLKVTWSAWDQGRWKKDRMGLSLGILIKIPPKWQVLNSLSAATRTLAWRDRTSLCAIPSYFCKCLELNRRASWDDILVCWGGHWK